MADSNKDPGPDEAAPSLETWLRGVIADIIQVDDPDSVTPDDDGDYSLVLGSSETYIRILQDPQRLVIFSDLVTEANEHPDLFIHLNQINANLDIGSVHFANGRICLRHTVLAESLSFGDVRLTLTYFSEMADTYDHKLQERFGGSTALRQETGDEIDV